MTYLEATVLCEGSCVWMRSIDAAQSDRFRKLGLTLHWFRGSDRCAPKCPGCDHDAPDGTWVTRDPRMIMKMGDARLVHPRDSLPIPVDPSRATTADIEVPVPEGMILRAYQKAAIEYASKRKGTMMADEMGCVAGDTILNVNRASIGRKYKISMAYAHFTGVGAKRKKHVWRKDIPTFCRALVDGELHQHRIKKIIHAGRRPVVKLVLADGKSLRLTPDHEVALAGGGWCAAGKLVPGTMVMTNGTPVCTDCGGTDRVSTYKYAKFPGVCRKCMYRKHRINSHFKTGKFVDGDGYVRVSRQGDHPRQNLGAVYEHILVMEDILGRFIVYPEQVHHKNGIRSDNRPENLELVTCSEHHRLHSKFRNMEGGTAGRGGKIKFIPSASAVVSVQPDGTSQTYDVIMEDPHRNFVANGIIVHNCGKTVQAIGLTNYLRTPQRILVICPATLKENWKREIETWDVNAGTAIVCDHADDVPAQSSVRLWCITNPDRLVAAKTKTSADTRERAGGLWAKLMEISWDVLIIDEAHRFKNSRTLRAPRVLGQRRTKKQPAKDGLVQRSKVLVALTGTPIPNRVKELWPIVSVLAPEAFKREGDFLFRYCGAKQEEIYKKGGHGEKMTVWNFDGASNLDELQSLLRASCMIRRMKRDVLTELPAKTRQILPLPLDALQDAADAEREGWLRLKPGISEIRAEALVAEAMEDSFAFEAALDKLDTELEGLDIATIAAERQAFGLAKVPLVIEHVMDALEDPAQKVVVMAHHREVIKRLSDLLSFEKIKTVSLFGETPMNARQGLVDAFQTDPDVRVLVGGIHAAGVGITLTAANLMVFAEADWQPGVLAQCEDRIHRISQEKGVLIQYLVVDGSIEALVLASALRKQRVIDQALDAPLTGRKRRTDWPKATDTDRKLCGEALEYWRSAISLKSSALKERTLVLVTSLADRFAKRRLTDGEIWLCKKIMRENPRTLPAHLRAL